MEQYKQKGWYKFLRIIYIILLLIGILAFLYGWFTHDDVCIELRDTAEQCVKNYQLATGFGVLYTFVYLMIVKVVKLVMKYILLGRKITMGDFIRF